MVRAIRRAGVVAAVGAALFVSAPAASAAEPYCGIAWGSLAKQAGSYSTGSITDVRAGGHDCFDRIVIDVDGPVAGYSARYVDEVVQPGSGLPVPVRGGATLALDVYAPTYDDHGHPVYDPADPQELVPVGGYSTLRQVALAGSFEGQTTFAVGVRARLPFRVFTLSGPGSGSRVVLDVAHRW